MAAHKDKFRVTKELHLNTSDDIWMRFQNIDNEMACGEISVSDPEDYLAVKMPVDDAIIISDTERLLTKDENEQRMTADKQSIMVTSDTTDIITNNDNIENVLIPHDSGPSPSLLTQGGTEFPQCSEHGIFCYDMNDNTSTEVNFHYHCPSCLCYCENDIQLMQHHYNDCIVTPTSISVTTLCQHDNYIQFTECRSADQTCPALDMKTPAHYHCPCCFVFAQQNIFQVIKHQLNCCKSLMDWNQGDIPPTENSIDNPCLHNEGVVNFLICYKSDPGCYVDCKKECHFHCPCCEEYSESRVRLLKKHQKGCCKSCNKVDRMNYVLNVATAVERVYISGNILNRKRRTSRVVRGNSKSRKILSQEFDQDNKTYQKCFDKSCSVREHTNAHMHCPSCETYTATRISRLKAHYKKCIKNNPGIRAHVGELQCKVAKKCIKKKPEIRAGVGELQCKVADKTNGIFIVRGAIRGPGMPAHVIYRPPHLFYCDDGCKNDDAQYFCKHIQTCERLVKNGYLDEVPHEVQDSSCLGNLLHLDESSKSKIYVLFQQCLEIGVPAIRHFKPETVRGKHPSYIFVSVSSCTSPKYYTRSGRVMVHYNVKKNQYKCKCMDSECVHVLVARIYLEHNDILNAK